MEEAIIWVRVDLNVIRSKNNSFLSTDIESPEIVAQKPTDQTLSDTPHIDKPKEQKPPKIDEPLRNKTSELEGLDMSNLPKVEETKLENSNSTNSEKVGISSQNINNILIGKENWLKEIIFKLIFCFSLSHNCDSDCWLNNRCHISTRLFWH